MSYANDLEIVSTFAMQDTPQPPQPPAPSIVPSATNATVPKDPESMEVDEKKDIIDKAISGESKKNEEGYESSDLELSSDEEEEDEESSDSSSEEEEEDSDIGEEKSKSKDKNSDLIGEEDEVFADGIVKTVNEIVDITIEKPTFDITPQTEIVLAGSIFQIIGNVIVIHCRPGSEYNTLDQGSLLVYENREIMGEVFETFGPVSRPYYSVRFNDAKEINMEHGKIGASVFYVPTYKKTQIVETEALKKIKGTDASNIFDEEVGEDEMEFSDDEKEKEFKRRRKNRAKKRRNEGNPINATATLNNNRTSMNRHRPRPPPRDEPVDFDQALAAYQGAQLPPRQQQSYADITDYVVPETTQRQQQYQQQYQQQPQQQPQQQQGSSYLTPAELVSALFKSYNGQLPTQLPPQQPSQQPSQQQNSQPSETSETSNKSLQSIFSTPPPPID